MKKVRRKMKKGTAWRTLMGRREPRCVTGFGGFGSEAFIDPVRLVNSINFPSDIVRLAKGRLVSAAPCSLRSGTYATRGTYAKLSSSPLGLITFVSPLTKLGNIIFSFRWDRAVVLIRSLPHGLHGDSRTANERGEEERKGKERVWTERNREREREREREKSWTASFSDFPTQIESY